MLDALENGVSKYPALEGRFPQVAGMSYGFDPSKPPNQRVEPMLIKVQGEYLDLQKVSVLRKTCFNYVFIMKSRHTNRIIISVNR